MYKNTKQLWQIKRDHGPEAAKTMAANMMANPRKYYVPCGINEDYIRLIAESTQETRVPVVMFWAANGVGKTTSTLQAIVNFVYGPQNGWFDYPLFRQFPFPKTIWYCSEADSFKDPIWPELEKLLEPGTYTTSKEGKSNIPVSRIDFENGWKILFKTYEQDPKTFESANVGIIVGDEPMPESIWKSIKSRRRKGCLILLPMTPLYTPPYIIDEIADAAEKGQTGYYQLDANVYEACKVRGERGFLDPDIIDDMLASYDDEEVMARGFGRAMYFSNRIYRHLDAERHFRSLEEFPFQPFYQLYFVADPHDARPTAGIWAWKQPNNRIVIFDEFPFNKRQRYWDMQKQYDHEEELRRWVQRENEWIDRFGVEPFQRTLRIMDRHFGFQRRGGTTIAEIMANAYPTIRQEEDHQGSPFLFVSSYVSNSEVGEVQAGHKLVRHALKDLDDGEPGLVILDNCLHTWRGLTHYIRRHETGKRAEEKPAGAGKIVDKFKDFPDTVRYLVGNMDTIKQPEETMTREQRKMDMVKHPEKYEDDETDGTFIDPLSQPWIDEDRWW